MGLLECYSRKSELEYLETVFKQDGPDIIAVHGIAGIGKSTLLREFVKNRSAKLILFNCQLIEPTPTAFTKAFIEMLGRENQPLQIIADKIEQQTVIILDQFESFRLLETWFRREFMIIMQGKIRLIFASRVPPDYQWIINPPVNCRYSSLKLSSFSFKDSVDFLQRAGHSKVTAMGINQFANGHPLALRLASAAILEQPGRQLSDISLDNVIQALVHYFLEDIQDVQTRAAVEATATVRRVSESVLAAMLDLEDKSTIYNKLSQVDFIEHRSDGLSLHDLLKHAIAAALKAKSPQKLSEYRNRASRILQQEMKTSDSSNLWRYTADIIYLVDNNVIRDAFFPQSDHREYSVEPAVESDLETIMLIVEKHEPEETLVIYQHWWLHAQETFHCIKDSENQVVGFYCLINPALISDNVISKDPITAAWWKHNQDNKIQGIEPQALFIRRWLSLNEGEAPSGVQAACWLDIKRAYLAMRPNLRRVYLTLENLAPYAMAAKSLGFTVIDIESSFNRRPFSTAMLDFGEDSVDGWIAKTLVNEINEVAERMPPLKWFDKPARQLVFKNEHVDLTPLEYGTLTLLINNQGVAISRKELLEKVWDIHYEGASNVVDTVILTLRKKLRDKASLIQSVRGIGYRFIRAE
ncbi:winged helix-turn-helix domain-containing protein [Psychromonas sp.]|uniref:winged helix-turn-helix domain-containing protein n=1 Tax=Psychromonas sp. TaxID=1884585 RepID=UPI0035619E2C